MVHLRIMKIYKETKLRRREYIYNIHKGKKQLLISHSFVRVISLVPILFLRGHYAMLYMHVI